MRMAAVATAAGVAYALGWLSRQPQIVAARREASTDSLTGLMNRAGLKHQLRIRANRRQPYTLYMLDLNGFKPVNDTYGHRAGDALLQTLAARLRAQLAGHLVARLGGDEFMVLVDEPQLAPAIDAFAQRIQRITEQPIGVPGSPEPVVLGTAIGAARATGRADYRATMHAADLAMYRSKDSGQPVQLTVSVRRTVDESPRTRIRDTRPVRVA